MRLHVSLLLPIIGFVLFSLKHSYDKEKEITELKAKIEVLKEIAKREDKDRVNEKNNYVFF